MEKYTMQNKIQINKQTTDGESVNMDRYGKWTREILSPCGQERTERNNFFIDFCALRNSFFSNKNHVLWHTANRL